MTLATRSNGGVTRPSSTKFDIHQQLQKSLEIGHKIIHHFEPREQYASKEDGLFAMLTIQGG